MSLTPWLLEPLYSEKKVRLSAITSFENSNKMNEKSSDSESEEIQISPIKQKIKPKKLQNKTKTKRDVFDETICSTSNYVDRELLWTQLGKIPLPIRNIAEKFLIYLVIKQQDHLRILPNGRIIINNHEIPGSNIAKILTNILSNRSKTVDSGELAILTLLKQLPAGLYSHISKSKRKWCLDYQTQPMPSSSRFKAIPVKSRDKNQLITANPKDGVLLTPDMRPKLTKSTVLPDSLKIKGTKPSINPVGLKMNENNNLNAWYQCLDLSHKS